MGLYIRKERVILLAMDGNLISIPTIMFQVKEGPGPSPMTLLLLLIPLFSFKMLRFLQLCLPTMLRAIRNRDAKRNGGSSQNSMDKLVVCFIFL